MTTGKDDLTKQSGVGLNGSYNANKLGFINYKRCDGKHQAVKNYPNVTDPYKKNTIIFITIFFQNLKNLSKMVKNGQNQWFFLYGDFLYGEDEWNIWHNCTQLCCVNENIFGSNIQCPIPCKIEQNDFQDDYIFFQNDSFLQNHCQISF